MDTSEETEHLGENDPANDLETDMESLDTHSKELSTSDTKSVQAAQERSSDYLNDETENCGKTSADITDYDSTHQEVEESTNNDSIEISVDSSGENVAKYLDYGDGACSSEPMDTEELIEGDACLSVVQGDYLMPNTTEENPTYPPTYVAPYSASALLLHESEIDSSRRRVLTPQQSFEVQESDIPLVTPIEDACLNMHRLRHAEISRRLQNNKIIIVFTVLAIIFVVIWYFLYILGDTGKLNGKTRKSPPRDPRSRSDYTSN